MAKGTQTFWVLSQLWNINRQMKKKTCWYHEYWSVYTWENQGDFHQIADVYETAWNLHQIKAKIDIVVYCIVSRGDYSSTNYVYCNIKKCIYSQGGAP